LSFSPFATSCFLSRGAGRWLKAKAHEVQASASGQFFHVRERGAFHKIAIHARSRGILPNFFNIQNQWPSTFIQRFAASKVCIIAQIKFHFYFTFVSNYGLIKPAQNLELETLNFNPVCMCFGQFS
jgi:hypothetical protein